MRVCEPTEQRRRDCRAGRILYRNPHVAQRMELLWQLCQELIGRELVMDEFCRVADQKLRKPHGRIHLDTDLRACPHDRDAACDEHRQKIDQNEGQKKLGADGASVPQRPRKATLSARKAQRCNRCCRLRGDACPPWPRWRTAPGPQRRPRSPRLSFAVQCRFGTVAVAKAILPLILSIFNRRSGALPHLRASPDPGAELGPLAS